MLNCIQRITARNRLSVPLPNSSLTTRKNILTLSESLYSRTILHFTLPEEFYGRNNNNELIVCAYATVIDPLSLIAEQLLLIEDVNLFHLNPVTHLDESGDRIFAGPTSANAFKKCYDAVKDIYGDTFYPLCISIMADGVIMNKVHNKSSKPCYIRLSNFDDRKICRSKFLDQL